jgi:hypothetical protein
MGLPYSLFTCSSSPRHTRSPAAPSASPDAAASLPNTAAAAAAGSTPCRAPRRQPRPANARGSVAAQATPCEHERGTLGHSRPPRRSPIPSLGGAAATGLFRGARNGHTARMAAAGRD